LIDLRGLSEVINEKQSNCEIHGDYVKKISIKIRIFSIATYQFAKYHRIQGIDLQALRCLAGRRSIVRYNMRQAALRVDAGRYWQLFRFLLVVATSSGRNFRRYVCLIAHL
jgi:hypothetical protein